MYIFPKYNIQSMKLKLDVQLNIPHPPDINFTNIQSREYREYRIIQEDT